MITDRMKFFIIVCCSAIALLCAGHIYLEAYKDCIKDLAVEADTCTSYANTCTNLRFFAILIFIVGTLFSIFAKDDDPLNLRKHLRK